MLVNVQSADVFASHVLNRDVWARPAARNLLDTSYVLWQVDASSTDGARYLTYYPGGSPPVVAVVDPRSGERVCSWSIDGPTGELALREAHLVAELRNWSSNHVLSSGGDAALAAALAASLENGSAELPAAAGPPPPVQSNGSRAPAAAPAPVASRGPAAAAEKAAAPAVAAPPPPHLPRRWPPRRPTRLTRPRWRRAPVARPLGWSSASLAAVGCSARGVLPTPWATSAPGWPERLRGRSLVWAARGSSRACTLARCLMMTR